jgi:hypothetical protein
VQKPPGIDRPRSSPARRRLRDQAINEEASVQRLLIVVGILIVLAGVLWPWLSKLPLGRLPGDVVIDRPGFKVFAPFTTMLVLSIVISVLIWLLRR